MKAIQIEATGGPDQLVLVERPDPVPAAGQVVVAIAAAGVNFMDIGVRSGALPSGSPLPLTPGVEGSGRVIALGEAVETLVVGQRVAWVYAPGSYAERIAIAADAPVPLPDAIDDRTAAGLMMQGLTASHFATHFYAVQPRDIALVHAAAGGVGQMLTQIIKLRGGTVIGRVSSEAKVEAARLAGADHLIVGTDGGFAEEVRSLADGRGVHVVYDGAGPRTFQGSLASLRPCGTFCWYGPVLGGPDPIEITGLPHSIKIGYATFRDHVPDHASLLARSAELFDWVARGDLRVTIGETYPLAEAAQAHRAMDSRRTTGKLLLIP